MAISGQQNINIGIENQQQGSDNLFDAFNKVQNNFTRLFSFASPFNNFVSDQGLSIISNSTSGTVTITNTGVVNLIQGTGISLSGSNGNVTISATGNGNVGVTSVGVQSNTLSVSNSPIVSSGIIQIDLPLITPSINFAAGEYTAPTITVDEYGRITEIANTISLGTVTSVAVEAVGDGLSVVNSPITSNGIIYIENTGVTKITGGPGIQLSGNTGEVTIAVTNQNQGTVSRIDFFSNNLTITGSPVTTTGNVTIDIPNNITISGNLIADTIIANTSLSSLGNLNVTGNIISGGISANSFTGNFSGALNGTIGGTTPNSGAFTSVTASSNITGNIHASSYIRFANTGGYYTDFKAQSNVSNSSFYVPNSAGTVQQVLGITQDGATQTLGWKTIPTQYLSVSPRIGASFQVSSTPVLRVYPISVRSGGFLNVNIS